MNQNTLFQKYELIGSYTNQYLQKYSPVLGINATVLITGETGTGKELIARWLHFNDKKRCRKPFVKITIPNIGENIFESEVFGYEKGSFTGAVSSKKGILEVAEGGTVFFDEIENASPSVQSKLLQLFEDRIYRKVGSTVYSTTEARFIAATNLDLKEQVMNNSFRSDLYYRLAVLEIWVPPLRERGMDIIDISNHYIGKFGVETGKKVGNLGECHYKSLSSYDWPGNVRELKNYIEKAVIFSKDNEIDLSMLPGHGGNNVNGNAGTYKEYMGRMEAGFLKEALGSCSGNIEKTAKLIGMSVPFIYKKIKEYGIKL